MFTTGNLQFKDKIKFCWHKNKLKESMVEVKEFIRIEDMVLYIFKNYPEYTVIRIDPNNNKHNGTTVIKLGQYNGSTINSIEQIIKNNWFNIDTEIFAFCNLLVFCTTHFFHVCDDKEEYITTTPGYYNTGKHIMPFAGYIAYK